MKSVLINETMTAGMVTLLWRTILITGAADVSSVKN